MRSAISESDSGSADAKSSASSILRCRRSSSGARLRTFVSDQAVAGSAIGGLRQLRLGFLHPPTHVERREVRVLLQLHLAFPHQLKACREGAGARRRAELRLGEIFGQVGVEQLPLRRRADHAHQPFARILQREDMALAGA